MDQDRYIGRLLDNRYEIQEVIGTGGMAVVYRARCHRLNRLVAIKILKDELSNDEEFRRRFHGESQAVAMLSHPNIVSVYDVSSTDELDYIVMELIDGISLKQYMEKKGVLNWKETLHFAIQIAKALEHAHSRGIIHRDIKPHNVMVLKNGSVKVADFGIARVLSQSNTLTKEALGSVHYISPEQAKGGRVDSRSDIYSLGVVMYEMITGRPPYDGEAPVSVAIQHINGSAPMPTTLNPNIPDGLEQIIVKAMSHKPADRYPTAMAMLDDMDAFRKDPAMLFDYNTPPLDDVTRILPAAQENKAMPKTTERKPAATQNKTGSTPARKPAQNVSAARTAAAKAAARRRAEAAAREERRNRMATIAILCCFLVIIVAVIIFMWTTLSQIEALTQWWEDTMQSWQQMLFPEEDPEVTVPDLVGSDYNTLDRYGWDGLQIVLGDRINSDAPVGQILSQTPAAGTTADRGSRVVVVVSLGPLDEPEYMLNLVGLERNNAVSVLVGQGVPENRILIYTEYSSEYAAGQVTRTEPAEGTELEDGQEVRIWISQGQQVVTAWMPYLIGRDVEDAVAQLREAGFYNYTLEEVSSTQPLGRVISQSQQSYTRIDVTTHIVLRVSTGQQETEWMPDVVGMTYEAAYELLVSAGFTDVTPEYVLSEEPEGQVVAQSVDAELLVDVNVPVVLQVSMGPEPPVTEPDVRTVEVTVDLSIIFVEPVDPFVLELRQNGQTVYWRQCQQIVVTFALEGSGVQTYDLYIDELYLRTITVDFTAEGGQ